MWQGSSRSSRNSSSCRKSHPAHQRQQHQQQQEGRQGCCRRTSAVQSVPCLLAALMPYQLSPVRQAALQGHQQPQIPARERCSVAPAKPAALVARQQLA